MSELTYTRGKLCRLYFDVADAPTFATPTMVEIGYFEEGGLNPGLEQEQIHPRAGRGVISTVTTGIEPTIAGKLHYMKGLSTDIWNLFRKRVYQASTMGLPMLVEACYGDRTTTGNKGCLLRATVTKFDEKQDKHVFAEIELKPAIPDSDGNIYTYYEVGS